MGLCSVSRTLTLARYISLFCVYLKRIFITPNIIAALVALRDVKNLILPDFEYVINFMSDVEICN